MEEREELINGLKHMADDHDCCRGTIELAIKELSIERDWISVHDELPKADQEVILYSENKYGVRQGWCDNQWPVLVRWYDMFHNSAGEVTHWQPLPDPPKDSKGV